MKRSIKVSLLALALIGLGAVPARADHVRKANYREIGVLAHEMEQVASHLYRITRRGTGRRIDGHEYRTLEALRQLKWRAARLADLIDDRVRSKKRLSRSVGELSRALDRTVYAFERFDRERPARRDLRRLGRLMDGISDVYGSYRYAGYRFRGHRR
jgi:hypothetical protein